MVWSFGEDRMLSSMESLLNPKRTVKYYCCCFRKRKTFD